MRQKITCWYRVVNNERQYNHFSYGWSDLTIPLAPYKKQRQMWKDETWEKKYGYLTGGGVREGEGLKNERKKLKLEPW